MKARIVVLGAGFGGLELSTLLSESLGDSAEVTLIDKNDSFVFGYAKLDVVFGHADADAVRLPYKHFSKPGVRMLRQTVTSIDPVKRHVTTDQGTFDADYLVVALGADYDFAATPGLADVTEFYSVAAAEKMLPVADDWPTEHGNHEKDEQHPQDRQERLDKPHSPALLLVAIEQETKRG